MHKFWGSIKFVFLFNIRMFEIEIGIGVGILKKEKRMIKLISDAGNRTRGFEVKARNVTNYTASEFTRKCFLSMELE